MDLIDVAKMVAALVATLALIGAAAWGARRFGMIELRKAPTERRIKVIESLMLDPRRRLVLVRFGEREHLLLLGPGGDRPIGSCQARDEVKAGEPAQ